ncbi:MAG: exopolysaccharide biosynthesis protein [Parachlamydiales bacterium]|nr:exopolysaccharide biosynthesis protein [Parachlamydiales bacterium]
MKNLEQDLNSLLKKGQSSVSFSEILNSFEGKGTALLLLILGLPACLPVQIPGLAILFALITAILGVRMALGKQLWLPKKLLNKKISKKSLEKIVGKTIKVIKKVQPFLKPRYLHFAKKTKMHGILIFLLGAYLAIPLPIPFISMVAGFALVVMALGLIEDDGLWILISYIISILSLATFVVLVAIFSFN